jgi:hypothetical protein
MTTQVTFTTLTSQSYRHWTQQSALIEAMRRIVTHVKDLCHAGSDHPESGSERSANDSIGCVVVGTLGGGLCIMRRWHTGSRWFDR